MDNSKDPVASFTLRLPESLRQKITLQAASKSRSLNSHIQSILEMHLVESGFAGNKLVSRSGRTFEVRFEPYEITDFRGGAKGVFCLRELKFEKDRARYIIGIDQPVLEDWRLENDRLTALENFGLALLNHYNQRIEIDYLKWPHPTPGETFDGYRFFESRDVAQAQTFNHFLDLVRTNAWGDRLVQNAGNSQDLRRGRNESDLFRSL
jgi:plasmid stability protein